MVAEKVEAKVARRVKVQKQVEVHEKAKMTDLQNPILIHHHILAVLTEGILERKNEAEKIENQKEGEEKKVTKAVIVAAEAGVEAIVKAAEVGLRQALHHKILNCPKKNLKKFISNIKIRCQLNNNYNKNAVFLSVT